MDPSLLSSASSRSRSASRSVSGKTGGPPSTATSMSPAAGPGSTAGSTVDTTAVSPRAERPSFSSFWKRTRTAVTRPMSLVQTPGRRRRAKNTSTTSASSRADGATPDASAAAVAASDAAAPVPDADATATVTTTPPDQPLTPADKARIRRAQVRRAQIQHRQRKAAYQEQLEVDIDTLRWLIDAGVQDVQTLQDENAALRQQVALLGLDGGSVNELPARDDTVTETGKEVADELPSLFGDVDLDEVLVSMAVDEVLGVPVLRVSSHSGESSISGGGVDGNDGQLVVAPKPEPAQDDDTAGLALDSDPDLDLNLDLGLDTGDLVTAVGRRSGPVPVAPLVGLSAFPLLTTTQKDEVVNLILALEHVCWGHVGHQFQPPVPGAFCADTGHTLMASSLVLRTAPDPVYTWMNEGDAATALMVPTAPTVPTVPTTATPASMTVYVPAACPAPSAAARAISAATATWPATGVSLETLYGLAVALNGQSDQELAPVQAWFELVARFPVDVLLRTDVLTTLKRELLGVVTCLYFGAVMERRAFESVVERVVVPVVEAEELP